MVRGRGTGEHEPVLFLAFGKIVERLLTSSKAPCLGARGSQGNTVTMRLGFAWSAFCCLCHGKLPSVLDQEINSCRSSLRFRSAVLGEDLPPREPVPSAPRASFPLALT